MFWYHARFLTRRHLSKQPLRYRLGKCSMEDGSSTQLLQFLQERSVFCLLNSQIFFEQSITQIII